MASSFSVQDAHRLHGAKGALEDAAKIITEASRQGECPLSDHLINDARVLAEGAAVLLNRVGTG